MSQAHALCDLVGCSDCRPNGQSQQRRQPRPRHRDGTVARPGDGRMLSFPDLGLAISSEQIRRFRGAEIEHFTSSKTGKLDWHIRLDFFQHPSTGSDFNYARSLPIKRGLFGARNAFRRVTHAIAVFQFNFHQH